MAGASKIPGISTCPNNRTTEEVPMQFVGAFL